MLSPGTSTDLPRKDPHRLRYELLTLGNELLLGLTANGHLTFIGSLAIGARAQAEEALAKLRGQDESLAHSAERILKSREAPHVAGNDAAVPAGPAGGNHGA